MGSYQRGAPDSADADFIITPPALCEDVEVGEPLALEHNTVRWELEGVGGQKQDRRVRIQRGLSVAIGVAKQMCSDAKQRVQEHWQPLC
jgi:hypothetical protein